MSDLNDRPESDLANAIASLDDRNASHWTVESTPRLSIIQSLLRDPAITRADIDAIGRTRCQMVSVQPAKPLTPEQAAADADAAEAAMVTAREVVAATKVRLRLLRSRLADSILIWQGFQPKRDVASLVRENSQRERDRKMAEIRGEIEPDEVQDVRPPSHLDAVLTGFRGNANRGHKRPYPSFPLGSRHLPSER